MVLQFLTTFILLLTISDRAFSASQSYNDQLVSLCNLGDNRQAVLNPDFEFEPLPRELLGCNTEFCFCKIEGVSGASALCPWELSGSPTGTYAQTSKKEFGSTTHCLGAKSFSHDATPVVPESTEMGCGLFVYSQAGEAGNWFSKDDAVMPCPTTWEDVETTVVKAPSSAEGTKAVVPIMSLILSTIALLTLW